MKLGKSNHNEPSLNYLVEMKYLIVYGGLQFCVTFDFYIVTSHERVQETCVSFTKFEMLRCLYFIL